ncbi:helix-turn-helix domain-containing protein [Oscillospiraceae bacterium 42-9]
MTRQDAYKVVFSDYPDVVNIEQLCEMLGGISTKAGYRILQSGEIKSFTIARRYRIPKANVIDYLGIGEESTA